MNLLFAIGTLLTAILGVNPVLQPIHQSLVQLPHEWLTSLDHNTKKEHHVANYPRIKKLSDGTYVMFYQGSSLGGRVYYSRSSDLRRWTEPEYMFAPYKIKVDGKDDTRLFSTMDALVLRSGELLCVCSFRAMKHYKYGAGCGLMAVRSQDGGKTWGLPEIIYEGPNWEPYLLQLPDGKVHCYFTDCDPAIRNSGISVLVSDDDGRSFGTRQRVCRQFKYLYGGTRHPERHGERIYTDQMPSFRLLSDNRTILGFVEARIETPKSDQGQRSYMMSLVYNDGLEWKPLDDTGGGPSRRHTNVLSASGGYVSVFPSGEPVLSCKYNGAFSVRVLDKSGELPDNQSWTDGWTVALPAEGGFWGSTEVIDDNHIVCAMHDKEEGMQIMQMYLNRGLDVGYVWTPQRLYLSSPSGKEIWFSARRDDRNLYINVDSPNTQNEQINIEMYFQGSDKKVLKRNLSSGGKITIPLNRIGVTSGHGSVVCFNAIIQENGTGTAFSNAIPDRPQTWQYLRFSK